MPPAPILASLEAAREAARIAQVGYTAVIDRMTPALTHEIVAANVARSVGSAGGAPAKLPALTDAWAPCWPRGAVSLFEEQLLEGEFGTEGTFAFGIGVESRGERGTVAATAVLHEPSERLRTDAGAIAGALQSVLAGTRPGATPAGLVAGFTERTAGVSGPAELLALRLDGAATTSVLAGAALAEGDIVAVSAIARTEEGPIVFQTVVHVTADGAERLDAIPLRLIELR